MQPDGVWRTASFEGNSCVEIWYDGVKVRVRNSRHPARAWLIFTCEEWAVFAAAAEHGEFTPL